MVKGNKRVVCIVIALMFLYATAVKDAREVGGGL